MSTKSRDREIVAALAQKIGAALTSKEITYDRADNLLELDLSERGLSQLPSEIWQLTNLRTLNLGHNRLSYLPPEIGQLTHLQQLDLSTNHLGHLPSEMSQLTQLEVLKLGNNRLSYLPIEMSLLTNLRWLSLSHNQLDHLPPEIGLLSNLQVCYLRRNQLDRLPPEIGLLSNLQGLYLDSNQLSHLPPEIGQLINLQRLSLNDNRLSHLPPEIGQLTRLWELDLSHNSLGQVPPEMGGLTNLEALFLKNNPHLLTPPPEIVERGTADILTFLRGLQEKSIIRHEAKLLIVGEGGTGKSSLLRALRNETFDPTLSTTHGIEVGQLKLAHPNQPQEDITLNTWDFGGQQIYHATHQFFLTHRSLYLVIWNARLGADQGRLSYWLDTIKALAPDSPVLLVATHIDECTPDLNYQLYQDAYPQLVGHLSVSNLQGIGIADLKTALVAKALQLPLMGQSWPEKWLAVEQDLLSRPEHHIDASMYAECCSARGIETNLVQDTLGDYLHDLGKILYFRDDYVLRNLVVLKPNWITKAISRVLSDEATSKAKGILSHSGLPRIWAKDEEGYSYPPYLYPVFLRLMERFDLSYQIEADIPNSTSTRSLIPQLLPHEPPANLPPWPTTPPKGQSQVEMLYRLDFVPTGIMSWFIVRSHRYTQNLHWREGVILEYEGHQARAELNPMLRELHLVVWGPLPQNFFTILKNTVDLILARFEGLRIQRDVPCICHWERGVAEPCKRFYRYEDLIRRMEAGRYKVECPDTFVEVSVPMLLYGIHTSTDQQVMADIKQGQEQLQKSLDDMKKEDQQKLDLILERLSQQSELIVRNFTFQWNLEMKKMEGECPNTFFLTHAGRSPANFKEWLRGITPENLVSQEYRLHLICQHPPAPHPVEGDGYPLRQAEEWWVTISPWLTHLIDFLKFGIPMGKAIAEVYDETFVKQMQNYIGLLEEITKSLPDVGMLDSMDRSTTLPIMDKNQYNEGPALRALHTYLDKVDPDHIWGHLYKTPTPEGNILWLCNKHRQPYLVKPLKLEGII